VGTLQGGLYPSVWAACSRHPPVRTCRLPFTSTVQDYTDRFNAMLGHTHKLDAQQKAELFVGGLPDHIRADVAIRDPQDLQSAMYLARAFEQRAAAHTTPPPVRGFRQSRPGLLAPPRPLTAPPTAAAQPAGTAAPA
jgi:hypothetical protein